MSAFMAYGLQRGFQEQSVTKVTISASGGQNALVYMRKVVPLWYTNYVIGRRSQQTKPN